MANITGTITTVDIDGNIDSIDLTEIYALIDTKVTSLTKVRLYEDLTTNESGFQTKIKNSTGAASIKGMLITPSKTSDFAISTETNEFDAIGVVAEDGIADGDDVWVWKNGSICQVLMEDGKTSTHGQLGICSATDGRVEFINVPSTSPLQAEHFKEIGHCYESKASGTDVLVLCDLHFN